MICWKIRIFAYWTTPKTPCSWASKVLWFAEKFVSLLIEQHLVSIKVRRNTSCDLLKNSYLCLLNNTQAQRKGDMEAVVICWKIRIFAYWTTPRPRRMRRSEKLWFAEKFVSLLIEQHHTKAIEFGLIGCDLLKNSYLCLLNNTAKGLLYSFCSVVICWKIRIFAYWTTPSAIRLLIKKSLWFAEKFVSLLIEQHLRTLRTTLRPSCDLLKNSYLCLLNNTRYYRMRDAYLLWFAEKFVSLLIEQHPIVTTSNNKSVVICWKIRIFAYWTTPGFCR